MAGALIAIIALGYLAMLAVAVLVFSPRPFVGGVAAVLALALGRALQIALTPPNVSRRVRHADR